MAGGNVAEEVRGDSASESRRADRARPRGS